MSRRTCTKCKYYDIKYRCCNKRDIAAPYLKVAVAQNCKHYKAISGSLKIKRELSLIIPNFDELLRKQQLREKWQLKRAY